MVRGIFTTANGYVTESLAADAIATAEAIVRSLMALRD
jgi:hypothetical protein